MLYGTQFAQGRGLYTLDINTGAATTINHNMSNGIGGLTYNGTTDVVVGINDGSGTIYDIDRATGTQTQLGNNGHNNDSGLAYDPEKNHSWDIDYSGNLFSYDPSNNYARTTHLTGLGNFDGMTYLAEKTEVPEPTGLALLGLSLLTLRFTRKKPNNPLLLYPIKKPPRRFFYCIR